MVDHAQQLWRRVWQSFGTEVKMLEGEKCQHPWLADVR